MGSKARSESEVAEPTKEVHSQTTDSSEPIIWLPGRWPMGWVEKQKAHLILVPLAQDFLCLKWPSLPYLCRTKLPHPHGFTSHLLREARGWNPRHKFSPSEESKYQRKCKNALIKCHWLFSVWKYNVTQFSSICAGMWQMLVPTTSNRESC